MARIVFILLGVLFTLQGHSQRYLEHLDNQEAFNNFSGLPLTAKYGQVSAIKMVYDLGSEELYFINTNDFKYHYFFCQTVLNDRSSNDQFNEVNYSNDSRRRYLLGNINYFKSTGLYALELSAMDLMEKEQIVKFYDLVKSKTFIGENLRLFLNSKRLQEMEHELKKDVSILNPAEIYKNLNYQPIVKARNCGVLRFVPDFKTERDSINSSDILVLNETPLFLPEVSGILVTEFQTPLSHLVILAQNRKIPMAAYKKSFHNPELLILENEKVCLEVLEDTFHITKVDQLDERKAVGSRIRLKYDLQFDSVVDIDHLSKRAYKYVGNKAGNFGVLNRISKKHNFKVPEGGFVIPFYFYNEHVLHSHAAELIDSLIHSKRDSLPNETLRAFLKKIRKEINTKPIDSDLLRVINEKAFQIKGFDRFRFRSSTNAEDRKGFSGAGLYTSKTGVLGDESKSFERAIKKVWASLWSYDAFCEREYYKMQHEDVYMGVLVHRSFPNEKVNGVAITKNLYRSHYDGFVVNAQLGEESVVNPKPGMVSDQFICYPESSDWIYANQTVVDIITQSNLNNDKLVMTVSEIQNLANQLDAIKRYFHNHTLSTKAYFDFAVDIEFKLDKEERELYIKQVRLYND